MDEWIDINGIPYLVPSEVAELIEELLGALKGTLYLFEPYAISKSDLEQIKFARAAIIKATGEA